MKTKLTILMTATLLAATTLVAQRGPGGEGRRGPNFEALTAAIELTEAQLSALQENMQSSRAAMRELAEQIRPLHEQMKAELELEAPNPTVVGEIAVQMDAIRDELKATKEQSHADALAVLTPSQQEGLTAIIESDERSREKMAVVRAAAMLGLLDRDGPGFDRGRGGHRGPDGMGFRGRRGPRGPGGPGGPGGPTDL